MNSLIKNDQMVHFFMQFTIYIHFTSICKYIEKCGKNDDKLTKHTWFFEMQAGYAKHKINLTWYFTYYNYNKTIYQVSSIRAPQRIKVYSSAVYVHVLI